MRKAELALINAPFEEHGWHRALDMVARATASSNAQLLGIGGPSLIPLNVQVGRLADYSHYLADAGLHGGCNWRVGSTGAAMSIQHEGDYRRYRAAVADTADYDDAVSDMDIPFGCQSAVLLDRNNLLGLALLRSSCDGPCSAETLQRFARLRHHLKQAVRVQLALDGEAAELLLTDGAALRVPTILLDRYGAVASLSQCAEHLFEEAGPLRLEDLTLLARDRGENRILQRAMAALLTCDPATATSWCHDVRIGRCETQPTGRWRLSLARLPVREHGLGFEPCLVVTIRPIALPLTKDRIALAAA